MIDNAQVAMWATLLIFNVAVIRLLQISLTPISFQDVLREKSATAAHPNVAVAAAPAGPAGPAGPAAPAASAAATAPQDTSYSRVTGMVGAMVIGCFVWGLGNVILFKAFIAPDDVPKLLSGVSPFLLSSSALFAPYAFNQLKDIGKK